MDLKGLTDEQVLSSRQAHGSNAITQKETETFLSKFIDGFKDPMIIILLVALTINVVFLFMGKGEWYEVVGIAVAILVANFVGVYSEHSNEGKFQALQDEASKTKSKVYRNGQLTEILSDDLVVGDIVVLQSGDKVPADGILVKGEIKVDQSTLNGETLEATKLTLGNNELGDIKNLLNKYYIYRGTVVCNGECLMEVKTVGDDTMYGALAKEMQEDTQISPLKLKLANLADKISLFGYTGGAVIALAFIFQTLFLDTNYNMEATMAIVTDIPTFINVIVDAIMLAVVIIVMAVPEGLPMMIALVLAMNMAKMMKDNVLVRKLTAMDAAGGLNILFSDKTGTITEGRLSVTEFADGSLNVHDKLNNLSTPLLNCLLMGIGVNNSASVGEGNHVIGGNSTDRALLEFIVNNGKHTDIDRSAVTHTEPFDSAKKYATVTINDGNEAVKFVKGAPEKILALCDTYVDVDGSKKAINKELLENYMDEQSKKSMRLIAVAITDDVVSENLEGGMSLVGLLSIRDNVRPEAVEAIAEVQKAGVQVVMVTGDRKETAEAIAKEAGLVKESTDVVLTSTELSALSDEEVKELMPRLRVVARALPMDKSRLVRLAQELNLVVAMTGDGVNDSPALKAADVGFAMGSGTEVAKEAGDIVILDDNFLSIEKAILYGRTIFKSISKFIVFQLTVNVAAVSLCFVGPLVGVHEPLTIIQLLMINMVMDTLGALMFGNEPALRRYMNESPISRDQNIITKHMAASVLFNGGVIFAVSLGLILGLPKVSAYAEKGMLYVTTMMFSYFMYAILFNGINCRSHTTRVLEHISENKNFISVSLLILVVQTCIIYFGGAVMGTTPLAIKDLAMVLVMAIASIPLDLVRKEIFVRK